jgi:Lar family restriction alleviation protein
MSNTLLPCPFCGGEALMRERYINGVANTKHYIRECRHCKATFAHWFRSIKRANKAWNRRANLGGLTERRNKGAYNKDGE